MISRKKLILIILVLLVIGSVIIVAFSLKNDDVSIKGVDKSQAETKDVDVTNLDSYSDRIGEGYRSDIREMLYTYLKLSGADISAAPSGVIRDGSYQSNTNEYGEVMSFLVDFPDLKRSYKVVFSNDTSGYKAVNIICPPATEMIYDEVECKDSING